jgi:phosphoribosylformylglycinamidine cyclo-ligase
LLEPDEYDVAGAATGVVERDAILGPERVRPGDVAIAMASSGLHSNGYSLVRHVLLQTAGWALDREVAELGRTLGEELLEPTRIYSLDCLALIAGAEVHALSHVTGGGLANNLARVVPDAVRVRIDRASWTPPPVFDLVASVGRVPQPDLEATLNQGVGMVALVPPDAVDDALRTLAERDLPAWVCGEAGAAETADGERVLLEGHHPPH